MLTNEQISQFAHRFQIDPLSIVREYLQVLFLAELGRRPAASRWYFKGGTAIRLLGNSFRFSEDLDFTVTTPGMKAAHLFKEIVHVLQREIPGLGLRDARVTRVTVTGYLRYLPPSFKYPLVVRVQCSLRERPLRAKTSLLETVYPIPYPWVQHLDWPEILAEKIRALLIRGQGRDLFDLWFLLSKGIPIGWPMVQKKMALYHQKTTPDDLRKAVERFNGRQLRRDLGPFLPREHRHLTGQLKDRVLKHLADK